MKSNDLDENLLVKVKVKVQHWLIILTLKLLVDDHSYFNAKKCTDPKEI